MGVSLFFHVTSNRTGKEAATRSARRGLGWTVGKISSVKELSSPGTGCAGKCPGGGIPSSYLKILRA